MAEEGEAFINGVEKTRGKKMNVRTFSARTHLLSNSRYFNPVSLVDIIRFRSLSSGNVTFNR